MEEKYEGIKKCLYKTEKENFDRKDEIDKMSSERNSLAQAKARLEGTLGHFQAELEKQREKAKMLEQLERRQERTLQALKELEREKFTLHQKLSQCEDALRASEA